jgi:hypothetical protein
MANIIRISLREKRPAATNDGVPNIPLSEMCPKQQSSTNPWDMTDDQVLNERNRKKRMRVNSKDKAASGDIVEIYKLDNHKKQKKECGSRKNIEGTLAQQNRTEPSFKGTLKATWNKEIIINKLSETEILGITLFTSLHLMCRIFLPMKELL